VLVFVTVAVSVIGCPYGDGPAVDEVNDVVLLLAGITVLVMVVAEVLVRKSMLVRMTAVIVWVPAGIVRAFRVATPLTSAALPTAAGVVPGASST